MNGRHGCALTLGLLLLGFVSKPVEPCGIVTHIGIGQRATEYFEVESKGVNYKELINDHQDAFQAGNPFPDTFYNSLCMNGRYHSVSEDTHWTPFTNATVNYIRRKYPQPWSQETEKLVAFLLGIVSHSVADTTWHSLGIDQGFLRTMGQTNFHGSFDKAHDTGDFGGDVVNMVESDTHNIGILDNWYIPTEDLVEIYKDYYGYAKMDSETITNCSVWMFLGRAGERLGVINLLYPWYSSKSPFLTNRMQDFFLGAMDDMTAWVTNGWRNTITMLDKGTSACKLTENPLYVDCSGSEAAPRPATPLLATRPQRGTNDVSYIGRMARGMEEGYVTLEHTKRGVYIKATDKLKEKMREAAVKRAAESAHEHTPSTNQETQILHPNVFYDTTNRYARVGKTLLSADLNNDGHVDLVIGAPGHGSLGNYMQGRVYVVYGTANGLPRKNLTLDTEADVKIDGTQKNGMFGHAVAVADLNSDGVNDLVVSAPSVGAPQLTYRGEVYVYFGQKSGGVSSKPDITLKCTQKYCNLGWSLASGDLNNDGFDDVIVGAPFAPAGGEQNGFVGVLYSKKAFKANGVLYETSFDWTSNGPQRYGWYGYSVAASGSHLVIGAPTYKICVWENCSPNDGDVQAAGKTFVFNTPLSTTAWKTFLGEKEFDYLGAYVSLGGFGGKDNVLAIGVPVKKIGWLVGVTYQAGVTRVYDISETGLTKKVEYRGQRGFARFGMASHFEDVNADGIGDVLVGSPHWTDGFWFDQGALRGRVFVFDGSKASGNIKNADMELAYAEDKSKFGTAITSVRNTNMVDLAVSAPGSKAKSTMGGRLAIFSLVK